MNKIRIHRRHGFNVVLVLGVLLLTSASYAQTENDPHHSESAHDHGTSPEPEPEPVHEHDDADAATEHGHDSETLWTCSMHPDVQMAEPGKCPVCNMNLIPTAGEMDEHAETSEPASVDNAASHDHATDHGQAEDGFSLIAFMGKFHPLVVHFPIALLWAAAVAEGLMIGTGQLRFRAAAIYCLVLAAMGAAVAVGLGWSAGTNANYPGDAARYLTLHRWLGTTTGIMTLITLGIALKSRAHVHEGPATVYRASLFLTTILVSVTGHLGASLVFGVDYFTR